MTPSTRPPAVTQFVGGPHARQVCASASATGSGAGDGGGPAVTVTVEGAGAALWAGPGLVAAR